MGDERPNGTKQPSEIEGKSHGNGGRGGRDDARMADIHADIRRLEDAAAEAKRPWYQRPPVLISLAAVLVSTTLTVFTTRMEDRRIAHRERAQKSERLQQTVLELNDLSRLWTLELSKIQNPQA